MISWRDIARGTLRRFVPAAAATALVLDAPTWIRFGFHPISLAILGVSLSALGLGYAGVLGAMRTRLRDEAGVGGRRAVVAGIASLGLVVAGAAVFRLATPSMLGGLLRISGLYFASAGTVTMGLYFPWLVSREHAADVPSTLEPPLTRMLDDGRVDPLIAATRDRDRVV